MVTLSSAVSIVVILKVIIVAATIVTVLVALVYSTLTTGFVLSSVTVTVRVGPRLSLST